MEQIGQLVAQQLAPEAAPEPRLHRVTLSVMVFAQIEVMAVDGAAARAQAVARAGEATRLFKTAPAAHRTEIRQMVDFRQPERGFEWIEIDRPHR